MDVAWSPHDAWLASCSVDNTVVIWNALKFPGKALGNDFWSLCLRCMCGGRGEMKLILGLVL